jgi:5-methylcytosine-specific restriction endonuclease McrA
MWRHAPGMPDPFAPIVLVEPQRASALAAMSYLEYLDTPEWHARVAEKLAEAGGCCQVCNAPERSSEPVVRLQVHHRTYRRRGRELWGDLTVLCNACHRLFHRYRRLHRELSELPRLWLAELTA